MEHHLDLLAPMFRDCMYLKRQSALIDVYVFKKKKKNASLLSHAKKKKKKISRFEMNYTAYLTFHELQLLLFCQNNYPLYVEDMV